MDLENSLKKLYSLHTFGIKLGLDNITNYLDRTGNPQNSLKTFHIAGSNGKGSTSSFIASILMEYNYKVGLYTSPHFVRFNERVKINNKEIPDSFIMSYIDKNEKLIDELKLTFFEVTTGMAFEYFAENKVDFAVIETGLGGRLDATNVITPLASVLTSISLEHTNILGNTIAAIAAEKAGIIKRNVPVFIGRIPKAAIEVIEKKCQSTSSELFMLTDYTNMAGQTLELYTDEIELDILSTPLKGDYQKYNASLAGLVVSETLEKNDEYIIEKGIKNVIQNTGIEGRYETFNKSPDIIFDSAHNLEGINNFLSEFRKVSNSYTRKILLFGAMKDKAIEDMLSALWEYFNEIHVTTVENNERAFSMEDFRQLAEKMSLKIVEEDDPADFIRKFKKEGGKSILVVLGSMYLLGQLKSLLSERT
jgi:dihydrofolate synthase/folylpolyglutamate synthase